MADKVSQSDIGSQDDFRNFFKGLLLGIPVSLVLWLVAALLLVLG